MPLSGTRQNSASSAYRRNSAVTSPPARTSGTSSRITPSDSTGTIYRMGAEGGTRDRLCVDAGPTENGHRVRGIGSCTRQLLAAMTPALAAAHGIELVVVSRRPAPTGGPSAAPWARRGWTAELTGVRLETSPRLANW